MKKAIKGKPCGNSVIEKADNCLINASEDSAEALDNVAEKLKKPKSAKPSKASLAYSAIEQELDSAIAKDEVLEFSSEQALGKSKLALSLNKPPKTEDMSAAYSNFGLNVALTGKLFARPELYTTDYNGPVTDLAEKMQPLENKLAEAASKAGGIAVKTKLYPPAIYYNGEKKPAKITSPAEAYNKKARQIMDDLEGHLRETDDVTGEAGTPTKEKVSPASATLAALHKEGDAMLGRKPSVAPTIDELEQEADAWRVSRGFSKDEGANGFSAEVTNAHDVGHPILHRLIGKTSQGLEEEFGNGLIAEEMLVHGLERLSYGDTLQGSLSGMLRLGKVLARNSSIDPSWLASNSDKIVDYLNTAFSDDNFSLYANLLAKQVAISKLVTESGSTLGRTASGA